ncbi:MAG TPA: flagellar basal body P-ring formation chaperone FlgA [Verrucomicrobiae bacterium]|jgi:flagella basal body P-ring formation protein FlgA
MRNFFLLSPKWLWLAPLMLALLSPEPVRATSSPGSTTFVTNAVVDGEGIYLSQLLMPDQTHPLPQVRLADAPVFGHALVLTRSEILEKLQRLAPELALTNLSGSDKIRITRRARALSETEIREQLTAALQVSHVKDKGELELRFLRPWNSILFPDEPYTLKVLELPTTGVSSTCIVRFQLSTAHEIIGSWQAPLQARVMRDVWVAKSALHRDQLFSEADVTRERRDVLACHESLLPAEPAGDFEISENIQAGLPIFLRSVRARPVVHRGQVVEAQVQDGAISIRLKVEVLENGAPGQLVRVRNPQSRREFRGKVQNEQTIVVTL